MVCCCSAYNCKETAGKGYSFHKFPRDAKLRALWCLALRRKNFVPSEHARLCSKHFTPDSYLKNRFGFPTLKKDAVPSVFQFPRHVGPTSPETRKRPYRRKSSALPKVPSSSKQLTEGEQAAVDSFQDEMLKQSKEISGKRKRYLKDYKEDDRKSRTKVHFEESQYECNRQDGRKLLKSTAVPTIFDVPNPPKLLANKRIKGVGIPKNIPDTNIPDETANKNGELIRSSSTSCKTETVFNEVDTDAEIVNQLPDLSIVKEEPVDDTAEDSVNPTLMPNENNLAGITPSAVTDSKTILTDLPIIVKCSSVCNSVDSVPDPEKEKPSTETEKEQLSNHIADNEFQSNPSQTVNSSEDVSSEKLPATYVNIIPAGKPVKYVQVANVSKISPKVNIPSTNQVVQPDEWSVFGEFVASTIREFPDRASQLIAQNNITSMLFDMQKNWLKVKKTRSQEANCDQSYYTVNQSNQSPCIINQSNQSPCVINQSNQNPCIFQTSPVVNSTLPMFTVITPSSAPGLIFFK